MRLPLALLPAALLAACAAPFADRFAAGSATVNTPEGAAYLVIIGPRLQRALNACIPAGTKGASPTLVLVADVQPTGQATAVDVEPDGPGTDCLAEDFAGAPLAPPPLKAGQDRFALGLKIETR